MRIDKQVFSEKLKQLRGIIPSGGIVEALQGVLIADGMITANNLNFGMQIPLGIPDCTERFFLPQRAIDLILRLPNGLLDIEVDADFSVKIKSGKINNKFAGIDPTGFPLMPDIKKKQGTWVDADEMVEAIKTVLYATKREDARPVMAAVLLEADGQTMNVVATESHRLSWMIMECLETFNLVVPAIAAQNLIKSGLTGKMFIYSNKTSTLFETNECSFYTRLVDQSYPKYQALFDPNREMNLTFKKADAVEALERASITADNNIVRLTIGNQIMQVESKSQFGEYEESVELECGPAEPIKISCNVRYALEALKAHQGETITGSVKGSLSPIILENDTQKNLFLPVRV